MCRQAPQICTSPQLHLVFNRGLGTLRATLSEQSLCLGQYHDVVLLCTATVCGNLIIWLRLPTEEDVSMPKPKACARKHTHAHNRFKPCIHLHFRTCKYIGINVKTRPPSPTHTHPVLTHGGCVREDHLATTIPWAVLTAIYLDHRQLERLTPPS